MSTLQQSHMTFEEHQRIQYKKQGPHSQAGYDNVVNHWCYSVESCEKLYDEYLYESAPSCPPAMENLTQLQEDYGKAFDVISKSYYEEYPDRPRTKIFNNYGKEAKGKIYWRIRKEPVGAYVGISLLPTGGTNLGWGSFEYYQQNHHTILDGDSPDNWKWGLLGSTPFVEVFDAWITFMNYCVNFPRDEGDRFINKIQENGGKISELKGRCYKPVNVWICKQLEQEPFVDNELLFDRACNEFSELADTGDMKKTPLASFVDKVTRCKKILNNFYELNIPTVKYMQDDHQKWLDQEMQRQSITKETLDKKPDSWFINLRHKMEKRFGIKLIRQQFRIRCVWCVDPPVWNSRVPLSDAEKESREWNRRLGDSIDIDTPASQYSIQSLWLQQKTREHNEQCEKQITPKKLQNAIILRLANRRDEQKNGLHPYKWVRQIAYGLPIDTKLSPKSQWMKQKAKEYNKLYYPKRDPNKITAAKLYPRILGHLGKRRRALKQQRQALADITNINHNVNILKRTKQRNTRNNVSDEDQENMTMDVDETDSEYSMTIYDTSNTNTKTTSSVAIYLILIAAEISLTSNTHTQIRVQGKQIEKGQQHKRWNHVMRRKI